MSGIHENDKIQNVIEHHRKSLQRARELGQYVQDMIQLKIGTLSTGIERIGPARKLCGNIIKSSVRLSPHILGYIILRSIVVDRWDDSLASATYGMNMQIVSKKKSEFVHESEKNE
ncbi:hypothetical protein BHYA_0157g00160 [Botrytis hyacinthi]|uniref:Uncharacterized protein n=1 Tax=Botrytis hyacinthi TaxID=278943 RepID=A0A4Z1GEN5_9HELO|nr:hypothetical protein BHYA_0157g00160 [Botrytis hyacinthi]